MICLGVAEEAECLYGLVNGLLSQVITLEVLMYTMSDRQLADYKGVVRAMVVLSNLRSYCGCILPNWLGMRDSNPRSWDQNPLPYHLANPH